MPHEWERIDQGGANCLNCGTDKPTTECKKVDTKQEKPATLPRESEKEKIKRQLYSLIDRVDKL